MISPEHVPLSTLPLTPIRVIDCKISRKLRLENAQNVHKNLPVNACHRIPLRSYLPFVYCSTLFPNKNVEAQTGFIGLTTTKAVVNTAGKCTKNAPKSLKTVLKKNNN